MKRIISLFIATLMVASMFTAMLSGVSAETEIVIGNASPAITATVGEKIVLSNYSVVFDGDTAATSNVVWKAGNEQVDAVTPTQKGVTALTATSGSKTKTVYIVTKAASDTEYVLYEADFSKYSSIDELKSEGWNFLGSSALHKLSGGTLILGSTGDGYARSILPAWLGDFGDYSITTEAKMLSTTDTGRWFGLVYRIQNKNGAYYPYYHMCVRENTTASGIEFAERTTSNGWNVVQKASGEIASLKSAYNVFNVQAKGKKISYNINGDQVLYVAEGSIGTSVTNKSAATYEKGMLGLTMNYGTIAFKNIKVTVQENEPEKEKIKLELINNERYELNTINPIANIQAIDDIADLDSEDAPGSILFVRSGGTVMNAKSDSASDFKALLTKCLEKQILPTFYIIDDDLADNFISAMKQTGFKDANVISDSRDILKKIRGQLPLVRTGLYLNPNDYESENAIRLAVRSAPATFCVIDSEFATREFVYEMQEYAVAVWVLINADDTKNDEFAYETLKAVTSGANGILSLNSKKAAEIIDNALSDDAMTRTPVMIGHRGNPSQAPENSLSGFIEAYNNGADVFEVDVEITKDKHIIIMHDNTINRTTNYTGSKTVNQMTLEEIKSYNLLALDGSVSDEKIPTLKEVLDEFKDKDCKIFVEFKGSNASNVPNTSNLIKEYEMEYLVDVISFSVPFINQTQTEIPGMSTGYLHAPSVSDCKDMETALLSLYESLVTAQNCNSTINPACGVVWSDGNYYTTAVTDRGITVWPWTYTYGSNSIGFLSGCDGVTTDDMQWVTDMAKYAEAPENTVIAKGQQLALGAKVITYGNSEFIADSHSTLVSVISGNDVVSVVDGKLVGIAEGEAEIILGYRTSTTTGGTYTVYTQPFTVKVESDKDALNGLINYANKALEKNYTSSIYASLKASLEKANALAANDAATAEEIEVACAELAALLNSSINPNALSFGVPYTTTAPNRGDGNAYNDDGKRLTDGSKSSPAGGGRNYSGWSSSAIVEVVLDMGEGAKTNAYTVYCTSGFWGISAVKSVKVEISDDGVNYTEIGSCDTKLEVGVVGEKIDGHTSRMYTLSVVTEKENVGRYVKFTITPTGGHTWIDEVEATLLDFHKHVEGVWTTVKEATETEEGLKELHCNICGQLIETETIPVIVPAFVKGDVNGNGVVDANDYALAKRHCLKTYTLSEEMVMRADLNGNGKLEASEYAMIKRHVLGTFEIK